MINGMHVITYAHDAEKARAFFKDVLGWSSVDAGGGWLIFAMPPSEIAAHPAESGEAKPDAQPQCELYLMCDDVNKTVADLKKKGVEFTSGISKQPWGSLTSLRVPGAGSIGLYEPTHPKAIDLIRKA